MKKTLIYHLYASEDYRDSVVYNVHSECLKCYKNIFDNIKVVIAVDDLENQTIINWAFNWVFDIFRGKPIETTIRLNTTDREGLTFYDKVLLNTEDESVFFFHTKGLTNFYNSKCSQSSIFMWICAIYFYSLDREYDTIDIIEDGYKAMCGPFLINAFTEGELEFNKQFFAGAGYWVNLNVLRNLEKCEIIPKLKCTGRFFAEKYPGMVLHAFQEYGLDTTRKSMYNLKLSDGTFFYSGTKNEWEIMTSLYGPNESFLKFVENISNKVGFTPFSE